MQTIRYALVLITAAFSVGVTPPPFPVAGHCSAIKGGLAEAVYPHHDEFIHWLQAPTTGGTALIDYLSQDRELVNLFLQVREHTLFVFANLEKQLPLHGLSDIKIPGKISTEAFLKIVVALHDIGKPIAAAAGSKKWQHEFTIPILAEVLQRFGFAPEEIAVARALVDNDYIGELMKERMTPEDCQRELSKLASSAGMSARDFFRLQSFFYTIDAGAYGSLRRTGRKRDGSPRAEVIVTDKDGRDYPNGDRFERLSELMLGQVN